jgi:hypothetical protein
MSVLRMWTSSQRMCTSSPLSSGSGISIADSCASWVPSLNRGDKSALKTDEARLSAAEETRILRPLRLKISIHEPKCLPQRSPYGSLPQMKVTSSSGATVTTGLSARSVRQVGCGRFSRWRVRKEHEVGDELLAWCLLRPALAVAAKPFT